MRRIDIDFSARPPVAIRVGRRIAAFALAAGLVAGGLWTQRYLELRHELTEWRDTLQRVDRRRAGETQRQPADSSARLKAELQRANRVIEMLSTPWPDLFAATETAYSEQAILMGMEPDTERREVRLTAEAKDLPAMLDYVKALRQSPVLTDAMLVSHQINAKDAQRPVRFIVIAHWLDVPPVAAAPAAQETPAAIPAEAAR